MKDQSILFLVIILLILITQSLDNVLVSLGENWCRSPLGLKGLKGLCHAICYVFKKLKLLRVNWIPKIMVQYCYLSLLGTKTVSCRLLQRMARIEIDWNLDKLGQGRLPERPINVDPGLKFFHYLYFIFLSIA